MLQADAENNSTASTSFLNDNGREMEISEGQGSWITTDGRRRCKFWSCMILQAATAVGIGGLLIVAFLWCSPHVRANILEFGNIPVVAAIVGWGTNVVAIKMTFYPLEFRGCFPNFQACGMPFCGWQGIIPASCKKMAEQAVDLMTTKLLDVKNTFSRLDPERVISELRTPLEQMTPKIIETVALDYAPRTWNNLPQSAKNEIVRKCLQDTEQGIAKMFTETHSDITQAFDLRELLVDMLSRNKQLVNDIFEKCAEKEFSFIRVSGFYLGFVFGLIQMLIWVYWPYWWILPVAGFVVGYLTNWVALKVIFQPVHPKIICGFRIQGLFLKRQNEVATTYAELLAVNVLNANNLMLGMISGSCSDQFFTVLDQSIQQGLDKIAPSQRLMKWVISPSEFVSLKARVSQLVREEITKDNSLGTLTWIDEALDVRATLEASMRNLSSEEFEDMIHPVFQEGELKLVLIGGFLGVVVGLIQAFFQFHSDFGF